MSTHIFIKHFIAEIKSISYKQQVAPQPARARVREPWIVPPAGTMKINVDGVVGRHGDRGVVVAICRDHLGNYLGSSSITFMGVTDVSTLEALACREVLALAIDLNITRVIVSSDSAMVVKGIETN